MDVIDVMDVNLQRFYPECATHVEIRKISNLKTVIPTKRFTRVILTLNTDSRISYATSKGKKIPEFIR